MQIRHVLISTMLIAAASLMVAGRNHQRAIAIDDRQPIDSKETLPPNVVLISLDTVRPDHLGCYGYDKNTSPNLDRLANQGVVFQKTWSQAPWTLPSHMSLFTSLTPSRHRVDSLNRVLPDGTKTLPQVMQQHGYRTVGLVNNAQMRDHWGFNRGFDVWREYQVDTPEGNCENITRQAVDWLKRQSSEDPFFLFLHYYDAHDAYAAPVEFRKQFSSLSGDASRALAWRARFPDQPLPDPRMKDELIGAYDAEIAWLDNELGKLFDAIPENTVVAVFSDHGEAFEEHGWTLHGATCYEEETRVALLMRLPGDKQAGEIVDAPVSLMDVAPTVLRQCGIEVPRAFRGVDLSPAISGKTMPARIVTSETKAVVEGKRCRSVIAYPWKLIVSEPDGRCELYRLPDESKNLASAEPAAVAALKQHIDAELAREDHWVATARGAGKHEVTLEVEDGTVALFVPHQLERDRDAIQTSRDGQRIQWETYPGDKTKWLYIELSNPNARFSIDVLHDDLRRPERVFIGDDRQNPSRLPVQVPNSSVRPSFDAKALDDQKGVSVVHYEGDDADANDDNTKRLDEIILQQLRALKYIE